MGALSELIDSEYGGRFTSTEVKLATNSASYRGVQNDPNCVATTIVNTGANDVYISPLDPASADAGIFLHANGGAVSLTARDDLTLAGREWYVVSPGGDSSLFVIRVIRYVEGK